MEPEILQRCSQQPLIGLFSEPADVQSIPSHHTLNLYNYVKLS
jgi:hypothetical protein